jgi:hypothetical protein
MDKYCAGGSQHPNLLLLFIRLHYCILCTYLSSYFLKAPHEYVHPGLVLGLDRASCQLPSTCIFFVSPGPPSILLFVSMTHVSHVHPPLTTRRLNASTQVKNMAVLHLIYNGHTYVYTSHNYYCSTLSSYFFYILDQVGWPRPLMLKQCRYSGGKNAAKKIEKF